MRTLLKPSAIFALALGAALTTGVTPASANNDSTINISDSGNALSLSDHDAHAGQLTLNITSTNPSVMGHGGVDVEVIKPHPGIELADVYSHLRNEGPGGTPAAAAAATRWLVANVGFYGGAAISSTGTARDVVTLAAGDYTVLDINSVFAGGAVVSAKLDVTGSISPSLLPAITNTIDTTSADRFRLHNPPLKAGGSYLVRNTANTAHFVSFQPVKAGTTDAAVTAAIKAGGPMTGPPPFLDTKKPAVQAGALSPYKQQVFSSKLLTPGTYDLECFIADDVTGMPHFFMGMHKIVVVK